VLIAALPDIWGELGDGGQVLAAVFAAVVAIGVWFAKKQLALQAKNSRFEVYDSLTRLMMDTDRVFIEHPTMRKYFYSQVAPPTDPVELAQAQAIAELLADFMEHVADHIDDIDDTAWVQWEAYFLELKKNSEVLRTFIGENREWYCSRLEQLFGS
jgi:hypothetical protein